jgi:hypothetical protein
VTLLVCWCAAPAVLLYLYSCARGLHGVPAMSTIAGGLLNLPMPQLHHTVKVLVLNIHMRGSNALRAASAVYTAMLQPLHSVREPPTPHCCYQLTMA